MPSRIALKKDGWKDIQSKSKQRKRVTLALFVLTLVAGMLILSWAIRFTQLLFSPLGVQEQRNYIWNGEFNINLLVRTSTNSLLSYNPKEEKITIIDIPDELFLDVPSGFGKWQLRAVYGLGQTQKEIGGDRLLKETLTGFFAVPIDGFLDFSSLRDQPGKSIKSAVEVVEKLRSNPFSGLDLLSSLKTDLTVWELLRLKTSLSGVRFDNVKKLDLRKPGILDQEDLPDGTHVLTADPIKLDSILSDLADPVVVSEHKTIAVFNATDKIQLAGKWARLVNNLGGNVIITNNAKERFKKTKAQGEKSLTLKRIRQVFGDYDTISPSNEDINSSRAQINVFIGEDYLNK